MIEHATDEDAARSARRASLRVLIDRAQDGLNAAEQTALRRHVHDEQHDADMQSAVASDCRVESQALRQRLEQAESATERVRALHRKASHGDTCVYCAHDQRLGYDTTWPCDTIRALDGTLLIADD
ncbi:hypothetical protein [Streptomyces longispororuber]|uniref:hypothetical protein n=1 Tax=Streptomyces longispororuber TaxID=68230 RepID=UPI0036F627D6